MIFNFFQFISFLIVPLVLTIIIESFIFLFFNFITNGFFNEPYLLGSIFAINILTNPLLNVSLSLFNIHSGYSLLFLEVVVIFVEAVVLFKIYKSSFKKWFVLSLVMNITSYSVGVILVMVGLL